MRIVLTWDEFKMIELLLIHMKENSYKKEKGSVQSESGDYEITWNPQIIIVEMKGKAIIEKILCVMEGLEDI